MCQICTLLDNTWPTPKELAYAINEILPTEEHLEKITHKLSNKIERYNGGQWIIDKIDRINYGKELKEELIKEVFKDIK